MGVKGLRKFIKKKDVKKDAIQQVKLEDYSGKKIAIDVNLLLKNFHSFFMDRNRQPYRNKKKEVTSHLVGLFQSTINLIKNNIKPVYVFDGVPPKLKNVKEDQDEKRKISDQARKLLDHMGIPHVNAEEEAEAECCNMVKLKLVDFVATDDMDALPFGAKTILRNITSISEKHPFEKIDTEKVLKVLNLDDTDQLIDFCILIGCSYHKKIKGIGPAKAYKFFEVKKKKEEKKIEEFLKEIDRTKFTVPEGWENRIKEVQALYKSPKTGVLSTHELTWKKPEKDALIHFLYDEQQFDAQQFNLISVENGIREIENFVSRISKTTATKRTSNQNTGNGETTKRPRLEKEST